MSRRPYQRQTASGYVTKAMPIHKFDAEHPVDISYQDNDDGTVTARFDSIPRAYIMADDVAGCGALLITVVEVIKRRISEDILKTPAHADGGRSGALSLADLDEEGVQTRLIDGAYCTRIVGFPGAMFLCDDMDALGALFSLLLQMAFDAHKHDHERASAKGKSIHGTH